MKEHIWNCVVNQNMFFIFYIFQSSHLFLSGLRRLCFIISLRLVRLDPWFYLEGLQLVVS